MNKREYLTWLFKKFLPKLAFICEYDTDVVDKKMSEIIRFHHAPGSCFSYANWAFILSAWLNEGTPKNLIKFAEDLQDLRPEYWKCHTDKNSVCPVLGEDFAY